MMVLCFDVVQVVILENLSGLAHLGIQVHLYLVCYFVNGRLEWNIINLNNYSV